MDMEKICDDIDRFHKEHKFITEGDEKKIKRAEYKSEKQSPIKAEKPIKEKSKKEKIKIKEIKRGRGRPRKK